MEFILWQGQQRPYSRQLRLSSLDLLVLFSDKAIFYCDKVKVSFDTIREHVDALEMIIDDEIWPMVKYRELVTIR